MSRSAGQYQTTLARVLVALLAGAGVGRLSTAAMLMNVQEGLHFTWQTGAGVLQRALYGEPILTAIMIGLGMLVWTVLHQTGRRGWQDFLLAGALVRPAAAILVSRFVYDEQGPWSDYLPYLGFFACQGAVVGMIVWRIAYRWVPSSAEPAPRSLEGF